MGPIRADRGRITIRRYSQQICAVDHAHHYGIIATALFPIRNKMHDHDMRDSGMTLMVTLIG